MIQAIMSIASMATLEVKINDEYKFYRRDAKMPSSRTYFQNDEKLYVLKKSSAALRFGGYSSFHFSVGLCTNSGQGRDCLDDGRGADHQWRGTGKQRQDRSRRHCGTGHDSGQLPRHKRKSGNTWPDRRTHRH